MTSDCQVDTPPRDWNHARDIWNTHKTHGAACLRALVADAALAADSEDWR